MLSHATRKEVFTALFDVLKTVQPPTGTHWKTTSQHLRQWDEIQSAEQPALFLHRGPQDTEQVHAYGVARWLWRVTVWVYYRTENYKTSSHYPDELTDQFLDNFEDAFKGDENGAFTLGDKVQHCWLDGTCYFDAGINDNQGVIVIPLSILI